MKRIIALILFTSLIVLIIYNPFKVQSERNHSSFEKDITDLVSKIPNSTSLSFESFILDPAIMNHTRLILTPKILVCEGRDTTLLILNSNDSIPLKYSNYKVLESRESDSLNLLLISKL